MKTSYIENISQQMPSFVYCGRKDFIPNEVHVKRVFPTFNLMFVRYGKVCLWENGKEYEILPGEWFIQTVDTLHYGIHPQQEAASFYFIHFVLQDEWLIRESKDGIHPSFRIMDTGAGMRAPTFRLRLPMHQKCANSIFKQAEQLILTHQYDRLYLSQSKFLNLLEDMSRTNGPINEKADAILAYIHAHFLEGDFNLSLLSSKFGYTRQYITRLLKEQTGKTFSEYIRYLKLDYTKKQLAEGNRKLSSLAEQLGYSDLASFSHMFRKELGESPRAYCQRIFQTKTL